MERRLILSPIEARVRVTGTITPYFDFTFARIDSSSPPVTSCAVHSVGDEPSLTLPRTLHGWTVARLVWARRLPLPDPELV
ncbi:MAG: hypothetical protein WKF58_08730 [Ilumatobacteraceae bacterium]